MHEKTSLYTNILKDTNAFYTLSICNNYFSWRLCTDFYDYVTYTDQLLNFTKRETSRFIVTLFAMLSLTLE